MANFLTRQSRRFKKWVRKKTRRAWEETKDLASEHAKELITMTVLSACSTGTPAVGIACAVAVTAAIEATWPMVDDAIDAADEEGQEMLKGAWRAFRTRYLRKRKKKKLSRAEEADLRRFFEESVRVRNFLLSSKPTGGKEADTRVESVQSFFGVAA